MQCKCGKELRVVRTVKATPVSKATEVACPDCHRTYVTVTMVMHEQGDYGSGAHGVAKRLADGRIKLSLEECDGVEQ